MHGRNEAEFLAQISGFIGCYYLFVAMMNAAMAFILWVRRPARRWFSIGPLAFTAATFWFLVALGFVILAAVALGGSVKLLSIPLSIRDVLDAAMQPHWYVSGVFVVLLFLFVMRKFFVQPMVAWSMLNLVLLAMGVSMTDVDFADVVTKPDNVPIVGLVYLLGFFTWLGAYKAVQNDERIARGQDPLEKEDSEKVLVWPDLVYTELICMVAITALLIVWGILLKAPLEEPASSVKTPNPSKAPWYFLGLQEMLVYYDPWMAGVVLPSMVIFGLMAIPFIDYNRKGNGYYTINERQFAYLTFQFGFLVLWVTLIVMGTFMRGPNWNFFGLYETWDAHKVEALNNVDLSQVFWQKVMRGARPKAPDEAGAGRKLATILLREAPGLILVVGYFLVLPPAMVLYSKFFRAHFMRMGFVRYMVLSNLLLVMLLLPIKMILRWTVNMKYFVAIPEYFLNF